MTGASFRPGSRASTEPQEGLGRSGFDPSRGEKVCMDCSGHNPVWFAPNALWNLVIGGPDAKDDPGGFYCPACFIVRAEAAGVIPTGWQLAPEGDATGWRDIGSAPTNGTRVIAWWPHIGQPCIAWVAQGGRRHGTWTGSMLPSITATPRTPPALWMPVPALPWKNTGAPERLGAEHESAVPKGIAETTDQPKEPGNG